MKITKPILIILGFCVFALSAFLLFEPGASPTGYFAYTPSFAIINPSDNISLNHKIEIKFITKGTNDLQIISSKKIESIELICEEKIIGKKLKYEDYNCRGMSILRFKAISKNTKIDIKFGNRTQQAII